MVIIIRCKKEKIIRKIYDKITKRAIKTPSIRGKLKKIEKKA